MFLEKINFRCEDESIYYSINSLEYSFSENEYKEIVSALSLFNSNATSISNSTKIETFIEFPNSRFVRTRALDELNDFEIKDDNIKYRIGSPSPELIISFLSSLNGEGIAKYRRSLPINHSMGIERLFGEEVPSIFDLLCKVMKLLFL